MAQLKARQQLSTSNHKNQRRKGDARELRRDSSLIFLVRVAILSIILIMELMGDSLMVELNKMDRIQTSKTVEIIMDTTRKEFSNKMGTMQMEEITEIKTSLNNSSKSKSAECSWPALEEWVVQVKT